MKKNENSPTGDLTQAPQPRPPNSRQRILVVEDDAETRRLNTEVLIYSGYHVDAAVSGAAAWEALQLNHYDLMVTGYKMPQVTGVDLLKKLHDASMAVPVIMATGTLPTQEFAKCPWLRPASLLLKPYTFNELLGTVKSVLHATTAVRPETPPPPNWPSPPGTGLYL